jgi:hypothetical protein
MIMLSGSGNYTHLRIWNGMTITSALSNAAFETVSNHVMDIVAASVRWASYMLPLSVALLSICHWNTSITNSTLPRGGGRHREGEIPKDNDVLSDFKSMLWVRDTVVLLSFMSIGTHLSNCAGDMNAALVYMTIGNQSSMICPIPSIHIVAKVTLLPIPINNRNNLQMRQDGQCHTNREVLNEILRRVQQHLTITQYRCTKRGYYSFLCWDGNCRRCKPVLAAWLPDCPRYSDLPHLEWHVSFWCTCSQKKLGDYISPDEQHPQWDHTQYQTLSNAKTESVDAELW